jgi:hypothetical protein
MSNYFARAGCSSSWLFLAWALYVRATPTEVIPPDLHGAIQPQVAVAPDQKIYVAFGRGDRIYCASSVDDARTFLPPQLVAQLPNLALGMRRGPRIVASDKQITISAVSHQDGNLYAWSSADAGKTWSRGTRINSVTNAAREGLHGMAGDQRGNLFVVWLDLRNGSTQLWGAGSLDGGRTWGYNVLIYQSPDGHICECCHPSVEVGANGRIRVMWRNWLGGSRDLYTASTDGGQTFGPATKLGTGTWPLNACPMDGGALAGPWSVWRRGSTVYYTDGQPGEHQLGSGKQPVVASGVTGPCFVWEENPRLMFKNGSAPPAMLASNGAYPAMAIATANHVPIVVWESSANGVQTILAGILK